MNCLHSVQLDMTVQDLEVLVSRAYVMFGRGVQRLKAEWPVNSECAWPPNSSRQCKACPAPQGQYVQRNTEIYIRMTN